MQIEYILHVCMNISRITPFLHTKHSTVKILSLHSTDYKMVVWVGIVGKEENEELCAQAVLDHQ